MWSEVHLNHGCILTRNNACVAPIGPSEILIFGGVQTNKDLGYEYLRYDIIILDTLEMTAKTVVLNTTRFNLK